VWICLNLMHCYNCTKPLENGMMMRMVIMGREGKIRGEKTAYFDMGRFLLYIPRNMFRYFGDQGPPPGANVTPASLSRFVGVSTPPEKAIDARF